MPLLFPFETKYVKIDASIAKLGQTKFYAERGIYDHGNSIYPPNFHTQDQGGT